MSELSKSTEDYLEAILILELNKEPIKSCTIADHLKVSKPAVHKAMDELISFGFIQKELYGKISFTQKGRKIAKDVYDRHTTLNEFLQKIGVSKSTSEHDCCLIEHVISKETFEKIKEFNKKN